MVIARAGRNTVSELLYLKIPSLLFATSCNIRGSEQQSNLDMVKAISKKTLIGVDIHLDNDVLFEQVKYLFKNNHENYSWSSGNQSIEKIISCHFF